MQEVSEIWTNVMFSASTKSEEIIEITHNYSTCIGVCIKVLTLLAFPVDLKYHLARQVSSACIRA